MDLNHKNLASFLRTAASQLIPVFVHGTTGIGKSYVVAQVARNEAKEMKKKFVDWNRITDSEKRKFVDGEKGVSPEEYRSEHYVFCDVRISQLDPSDLRGLPSFQNEGGYTEWRPNMDFYVLSRPETSGKLFMDEMNLAPQSVQAAGYQIFCDRCIGQIAISDGVSIVAAGNRAEDRANINPMSAPLQNRFAHVTLKEPSAEKWADEFAYANDVDSRIIGYLLWQPTHLMASKETLQDMTNMAFASPRTWVMASRLIKDIRSPELAAAYAESCVGHVAHEFKAFLMSTKEIKLEEILKDPDLIDDLDPQRKWVLISVCADNLRHDKGFFSNAVKILSYLDKNNADFAVSLIKMLRGARPTSFQSMLRNSKDGIELVSKYAKYVHAVDTAN